MNISKLFRRFWAYCFDVIIVCGIYLVIFLLINVLSMHSSINVVSKEAYKILSAGISIGVLKGQAYYIAMFYLSYSLLFLVYEIFFLSSKLSATPGKLTLGLEVVSYNGSNFFKIIIRSLLKVLEMLITPLSFLVFLLSAFNKTKQTLHDKLTNTCVITKESISQTCGTNPQMTLEEFFEEMKSRGLRMYSEQKALAEEIYGSPVPLNKTYKPVYKGSLVGVFVLVVSIGISVSFFSYFFPDIKNYMINITHLYTQK